jgi:hypothetical protein
VEGLQGTHEIHLELRVDLLRGIGMLAVKQKFLYSPTRTAGQLLRANIDLSDLREDETLEVLIYETLSLAESDEIVQKQ